jgi:threonylcarbamoyladenosine tRNA methylthiotransferase MtaB
MAAIMKQTTVAFRTLGCKLNQCETAQMQESLAASGYVLVDWCARADIRVINTCTVTARSDKTCRREIRLAKRLDPHCVVAVTGCYAQVAPEVVAAIPGVDLVLGNVEKLALAQHLLDIDRKRDTDTPPVPVQVSGYPQSAEFNQEFISHFHGYTRAFLKIQTGCDSWCAYCIIPLARGPARSMRRQQVIEQTLLLAQHGFREIVLTGINLGSWGRDTGEGPLASLLGTLTNDQVAQFSPLRFRLSSIEPLEVDEGLLTVMERAGDRIAHHLHLPLQSGSLSVLRRMKRPYSPDDYLRVASEVTRRFPDAALGADVIVGFPGETDTEFEETFAFIEQAPLTYLHVFSYSDRPGTAASSMRPKVHPETIHERSMRLRALGHHKATAFRERLVGSQQRALILRERSDDGRLIGITGNYQEVLIPGSDDHINRFARVVLVEPHGDGRWEVELLGLEEPMPSADLHSAGRRS